MLPTASMGEMANDICASAPIVGPWPPRLAGESADAFFARLIDEGELAEATRFVALRMGPRRAVWWGCLCVWNHLRSQEAAETVASAAVDAAVRWVLEHEEDSRRAAQAASDAAGVATPSGAVAAAAFWSGGSISLPDRPDAPAPLGVCAKLVANAVMMTAAAPSMAQQNAALMQSLRMAAEVLSESKPWATAHPTEAPP